LADRFLFSVLRGREKWKKKWKKWKLSSPTDPFFSIEVKFDSLFPLPPLKTRSFLIGYGPAGLQIIPHDKSDG